MCDSHNHNNNSKHNILFLLQVPNWSSVIYKWLLCAFHNQFLMFTFFYSSHSYSLFFGIMFPPCEILTTSYDDKGNLRTMWHLFLFNNPNTKSLGLRKNPFSSSLNYYNTLLLPLPSHLSCSHHHHNEMKFKFMHHSFTLQKWNIGREVKLLKLNAIYVYCVYMLLLFIIVKHFNYAE